MNDTHLINADCRQAAQHIPDESVDLGIHDPPFGIGEGSFDRHYKRDSSHVIDGYEEAPEEYEAYYQWTLEWMAEAKRVLKPNGTMYVVIGHSKVRAVLNAAAALGLHEINHVIWKYNFGVYTRKKFVTAHYHVLFYSKSKKAKYTFNTYCRYGAQEVAYQGGKKVYQDLEDVFTVPRDAKPGEEKNQNKLPDALIQKIIQYSSNPGDMVCDFFLGNFTTAYVARRLGRHVCGFEMNRKAFDVHAPQVEAVSLGEGLRFLPKVVNEIPLRQGEPVTDKERDEIATRYQEMAGKGMSRNTIKRKLQDEFQRGPFAIENILDDILEKAPPPPTTDPIGELFGG